MEQLEKERIIEPVQFADWAAPIVPVVKKDGSIRICGDYKVTVNAAAKTDTYPLSKIEDMFATLGKGKLYSKLDLAHAYNQIPLDEESKNLVTINTHKDSTSTTGCPLECPLPRPSSSGPWKEYCKVYPM